MPVKVYKPTSPGRRQMSVLDFSELTKKAPEKTLLGGRTHQRGGRNNSGSVTVRFQGGGHKRRYRVIDWKRDKGGIPARVAASSTTRTARRTSRCCTTRTGRSATSWRPPACRWATR
jgi:ribosomal protein L2